MFKFVQGPEYGIEHVEGNSAKGADSGLPQKRSALEQAKRTPKKRKVQSGEAENPAAVQAAWSTLAEGARLLVSTLKTAGDPMHAHCLSSLTVFAQFVNVLSNSRLDARQYHN